MQQSDKKTVTENTSESQFEMDLGDDTAIIEYIIKDDKIYLTHTHAPKAYEGQGIGTELVAMTLVLVREKKLILVPSCSFVAKYIDNNPEHRDMLSEGYQM